VGGLAETMCSLFLALRGGNKWCGMKINAWQGASCGAGSRDSLYLSCSIYMFCKLLRRTVRSFDVVSFRIFFVCSLDYLASLFFARACTYR
jgi:hypothetical protein